MAEDRNAELAALARQAVAAAGGLRLLVERMGDLGRRIQDYRDENLLNVASVLRGTAILIALDTGDMDLHEEVTGRRMHAVHEVAEWLREHGEGDGRPLPCRPGPAVPAAGAAATRTACGAVVPRGSMPSAWPTCRRASRRFSSSSSMA
ncbi:hypothetical protein [Streptomyces californicus]|uniref:hypothetical protein n=1 Tax=Streptomyces californicus TaxID=67351 RepID=UPI0037A2BE5A